VIVILIVTDRRAAFGAAHLAMCLKAGVLPDDPCFDDGYFYECRAMLAMIERGADQAEIAAYDAASAGIFDSWRDWFNRTLAEMPCRSGSDRGQRA
jgi:hypothetical protein